MALIFSIPIQRLLKYNLHDGGTEESLGILTSYQPGRKPVIQAMHLDTWDLAEGWTHQFTRSWCDLTVQFLIQYPIPTSLKGKCS